MVFITGIIVLVMLIGVFWLLRSMGRMGQQPSARERMKHSSGEARHSGPRASGLD